MSLNITNQQLYKLHDLYSRYMVNENVSTNYNPDTGYKDYVSYCEELGIHPVTVGEKLAWWASVHWEQLSKQVQQESYHG